MSNISVDDIKVGDVVDYYINTPFLITKLTQNHEKYSCMGFYYWGYGCGMGNLSRRWKLKLITDQSVINDLKNKYEIFQLCEIIEK